MIFSFLLYSGTITQSNFITFDKKCLVNVGEAFNHSIGLFTSPKNGIYNFSFSGNNYYPDRASIQVIKNENVELLEFQTTKIPYFDNHFFDFGFDWQLELKSGDNVKLRVKFGTITSYEYAYIIFKGKLITEY